MTQADQIARLLAEKDLEGLTGALRQAGDPALRASAAQAMAVLGDTRATEFLVRAFLEDPELPVRTAARAALDQLVGGQAEMAITVQRAAKNEDESWLFVPPPARPDAAENNPAYSRRVQHLLDDADFTGLSRLLRNPLVPSLRAQAALALAELENREASELLVRATREDPDPNVQAAAQQALIHLFGSQAETVLTGYPDEPSEEDPWLDENSDEMEDLADDEDQTQAPDELSPADLEGFVRIALYEGNEKLRFQAIRVISRSSDMRATDTLAQLVLWGDNRRLRAAARQALEDRYGEQAQDIIASYRSAAQQDGEDSDLPDDFENGTLPQDQEDEEEGDDDEEDDDEDGEEEPPFQPVSRSPSPYPAAQSYSTGGPVLKESGISWWIIILAVLGFAIIAAAYFLGGS
jgi:HEAT repeat protein